MRYSQSTGFKYADVVLSVFVKYLCKGHLVRKYLCVSCLPNVCSKNNTLCLFFVRVIGFSSLSRRSYCLIILSKHFFFFPLPFSSQVTYLYNWDGYSGDVAHSYVESCCVCYGYSSHSYYLFKILTAYFED